jgi:DNA-binding LacI/PurR family transcriptional regulator
LLRSKNSRVTINDVAERAGVSIATVSRVLSGNRKVLPATAALVQAVVSELGYKPNPAARGLASSKTNAIGVVVDEIAGEFFQPMLRGIEIATSESGFELLINCTHGLHDVGGYQLGEHNTDGLVVFAHSLPDAELIRLHRIGFPVVLLHRSSPPGLNIPCVTVENKAGAREVVDYLIEQRRYEQIAFLAGPEGNEDSNWRELGYRESLKAHDIPFDPSLVGVGGFDERKAGETVRQWLQRGLSIDAIFAGDDDSAIGALLAIKDAGLRVPEDIAVVGFDDIRLASYLDPPLTTVRTPIEAASRIAVEQLVRLIRTGEAEPLTLLPTELVVRRSCGCC